MATDLNLGVGAVTVDLSLCRPTGGREKIALDSVERHVKALHATGKVPSAITVKHTDYDVLMRHARLATKLPTDCRVAALNYEGIRLNRAVPKTRRRRSRDIPLAIG